MSHVPTSVAFRISAWVKFNNFSLSISSISYTHLQQENLLIIRLLSFFCNKFNIFLYPLQQKTASYVHIKIHAIIRCCSLFIKMHLLSSVQSFCLLQRPADRPVYISPFYRIAFLLHPRHNRPSICHSIYSPALYD